MAELPAHLEQIGHVNRDGDHVVVHIRADASGYLAVLQNHGPAWDRALELLDRLERSFRSPEWIHWTRHHMPETVRASAMHTAYDRRRRARRRRHH